jgi:hypothetical protein
MVVLSFERVPARRVGVHNRRVPHPSSAWVGENDGNSAPNLVAPSFESLSARRVGKHGGSRGLQAPEIRADLSRASAPESPRMKNAVLRDRLRSALRRRIRPPLCAYAPTFAALDVRARGFVVFHPDIRPRFLLYLAEKARKCSQKLSRNQRLFACFTCAPGRSNFWERDSGRGRVEIRVFQGPKIQTWGTRHGACLRTQLTGRPTRPPLMQHLKYAA